MKITGQKIKDLKKLKMQPLDLYLLALRQILINQKEIMDNIRHPHRTNPTSHPETIELIKRIEEFAENGQ